MRTITTQAIEKLTQLREEVIRRALAQDSNLVNWQWLEMPATSVLLHIPSDRIYSRVVTHFEGYRLVINAEFPVDFYRLEKM